MTDLQNERVLLTDVCVPSVLLLQNNHVQGICLRLQNGKKGQFFSENTGKKLLLRRATHS